MNSLSVLTLDDHRDEIVGLLRAVTTADTGTLYAQQQQHVATVVMDTDGTPMLAAWGSAERVGVDHPGYTYMPPTLAAIGSGHVWRREDVSLLALDTLIDGLWRQIHRRGVDRLTFWTAPSDWVLISALSSRGFFADTIYAARTASAGLPPLAIRWPIRLARATDREKLLDLFIQEQQHHAALVSSGMRGEQDPAPSHREIDDWLDKATSSTAIVATTSGDAVVGVVVYNRFVNSTDPTFPAEYGYLTMASVDAAHRRLGVGRALAVHALQDWAERDITVSSLHYSPDNLTGSRLWSSLGYAPLVTSWTRVSPADDRGGVL